MFLTLLALAATPAIHPLEFQAVISAVEEIYVPEAQTHGRRLAVYSDWANDWEQAFARRWEEDQLIVYGGVARIPGSTTDSLALVLCHELGHLYGGPPLVDAYNHLSVEGQADWFATRECWPRLAPALPPLPGGLAERGEKAALILTRFFAEKRKLPPPQIATPDPAEVPATLKVHASPQCRLDTFVAGLDDHDRPRCWYRPAP